MELAAPLIGQEMSLTDFLDWDQGDLGGVKYEWKDGQLEEAGGWMKADERKIVLNLEDQFYKTAAFQNGDRLIPETGCYLDAINATRIPDLAFFNNEQVKESEDGQPIPSWVIEIISPSDRVFDIEDKAQEYFDSGVKLVWQIFPRYERVSVLKSISDASLLSGDSICSAAPVLPEFEIKVSEIFKSRKS